jgi:twitching motility protein PilT
MVPVEGLMLSEEETLRALLEIAPPQNAGQFESENDTDFAYELKGLGRFRCNLFRDHKGPAGVFRLIPTKILTTQQLGLPSSVLQFCKLSKGLVVVTGPTGSGKSTTLAAMVDHVNKTRADHVITIEDPIEFVHKNQKCLINQREVGVHTQGFKRALRAALREDPDIVLIGEMRDLETVEIALETAETGHLVFGTLHTSTAPSTIDRIIDQFPEDRQAQIRTMLSSSLKGVVAQTLCKKTAGGRIAALEILVVNNAVSAQIREGKTFQIKNAMQTGAKLGMKLLNDTLAEYVEKKLVAPDEAYLKSVDKDDLVERLGRIGVKVSGGFDAPAAEPMAAAMPKMTKVLEEEPPAALPAEPSHPPAEFPLGDEPEPTEAGRLPGDPFEQFRRNRRR